MHYYSLNQRTHGPVAVTVLHQLYLSGMIRPDTLVMRVGTRRWQPYLTEFRASAPRHELHAAAVVSTSNYPISNWSALLSTAWILLGTASIFAFIPVLGFATWIISGLVAFTVIVLAIISLSQGSGLKGTALLLFTIFIFPLVIIFAPLTSTLAAAAYFAKDTSPTPTFNSVVPAIPIAGIRQLPADPPTSGAFRLGQLVPFADSRWVVLDASRSSSAPGKGPTPIAFGRQARFVTVKFRVTNTSSQSAVAASLPCLLDAAGCRFEPLDATLFDLAESSEPLTIKPIPSGGTRTCCAVYAVPHTSTGFVLEIRALGLDPENASARVLL